MAYPKHGKVQRVSSKHHATFKHDGTQLPGSPPPTRDYGMSQQPMDVRSQAERAANTTAQRKPTDTQMASPEPDPTQMFMQSRMGF